MQEQHKKQPEISIIVPVYKTERFLSACISSILAQTFTDFELRGSSTGGLYPAQRSRNRTLHCKPAVLLQLQVPEIKLNSEWEKYCE